MNSLSNSGRSISASISAWSANETFLGKFLEEHPPAQGQMVLLWHCCLDNEDGGRLRGFCTGSVLLEMETVLGLDDWAAYMACDKGGAATGTIDDDADGSLLIRSAAFSSFARPGSAVCLFSLRCSAFSVKLRFFNPLRVEAVSLEKRRRRPRWSSRSIWNSVFELQFPRPFEEEEEEKELAIDTYEWGGWHCMIVWWPIGILV